MDDDELVRVSDADREVAYKSVVAEATAKWGPENFAVTVTAEPSKNLTTGVPLLHTAVARRRETQSET